MFNISEATPADVPAIFEMAEKTWWPAYRDIIPAGQIRFMLDTLYHPETILREMELGTQTFLVLKAEGVPKAFASFGKRPEESRVAKLHKLYVLPDNQKKGYGQALIIEIKNILLKRDIHTLDLNVNRKNPARFFYEKTGFRILREEDIPIGSYWMNDFVMRLEF